MSISMGLITGQMTGKQALQTAVHGPQPGAGPAAKGTEAGPALTDHPPLRLLSGP